MSRSKLEKFAVIATRDNVMQEDKENYGKLQGKWNELFFNQNQEIVLEIGCGKGEYTIGMAKLFPDKNFLGIDIKGSRIWKGSTMALEYELNNVGFLRTYVEGLSEHFADNEISEIWVTFPDPRPKKGDGKKRLTSPRFLDMYQKIVKPGGLVHFKTDSEFLFDFTLEVLQERKVKNLVYTFDLYNSDLQEHTMGIQTTYEKRFLAEGVPIKYLKYEV